MPELLPIVDVAVIATNGLNRIFKPAPKHRRIETVVNEMINQCENNM